jgi:hypothetical protein
MKTFIEHCEANYAGLAKDKDTVNRALELFALAKNAADADSVYGRRIALVDEYLDELRSRSQQLNKQRGPVPQLRGYNFANSKWDKARKEFQLDGKLDEPFWKLHRSLRDLITGERPEFGTRFHVMVDTSAIYFGIHCDDVEGNPAHITGDDDDDPAIWDGDHVEILIESDAHSYYQIVVNPAGARIDLDRGVAKANWFGWSSEAEIGAHIGEDFWSLEVKIPFTEDAADPLHLVIGRQPTENLPWYFNLCRKRVREGKTEVTAFSPVGKPTFHDVMKFGKLYAK